MRIEGNFIHTLKTNVAKISEECLKVTVFTDMDEQYSNSSLQRLGQTNSPPSGERQGKKLPSETKIHFLSNQIMMKIQHQLHKYVPTKYSSLRHGLEIKKFSLEK